MRSPTSRSPERAQFTLLTRASAGRLFESELFSRDLDSSQVALWAVALLATPPLLVAIRLMPLYTLVHRFPERVALTVLTHRIFFIVYIMLAVALFTAVMWESLMPERRDYEVLGPLPVRRRTIAAARLAAVTGLALVFILAVSLPSALMHSLFANFAVSPLMTMHILFAHLVAVTAAGASVFFTLLLLRVVLTAIVGHNRAARMAVAVQVTTVVLLVEVFLFLPGLLPRLYAALVAARSGSGPELALPPLWFLGIYQSVLGGGGLAPSEAAGPLLEAGARVATMWLGVSAVCGVLAYLMSTAASAERTLETPVSPMRRRNLMARLFAAGSWLAMSERGRAVYRFTLASLARSRRHALVLAMYVGGGLAVAVLGVITRAAAAGHFLLDATVAQVLSPPLVLTYFAVFGLRSAFATPTEPDANWVFRLTEERNIRHALDGVAAVLLVLGVVPMTLLTGAIGVTLWGVPRGIGAAALHVALGALLCELALTGCRKLPFTCSQAPGSATLRSRWAFYLAGLIVFAYRGAALIAWALHAMMPTLLTLTVIVAVTLIVRALRSRRAMQLGLVFEEAPADGLQQLRLSEAIG